MKKNLVILLLYLNIFNLTAQVKPHLYSFKSGDNYGFINDKGKIVIKAAYKSVTELNNGNYIVKKGNLYGVISPQGKSIIPFEYDYISGFNNDYTVQKNNKYGIVNSKNKLIIPFKYDYIDDLGFVNNLCIAKINNKYGFLDKKGKIFIDLKYDSASPFYKETAVVSEGDLYFIINKKGERISEKYSYMGKSPRGLITYHVGDYIGLMSENGKILVPAIYKEISTYLAGGVMIKVTDNQMKKGIIDKTGKIIVPILYDDITYYGGSRILLRNNEKYGYCDLNGKLIIPLQYDGGLPFTEGKAGVIKDGYWGFIDENNNTVIDFKFKGVMREFSNGYAGFGAREESSNSYYTSDQWGIINKKGEIIIPTVYMSVGEVYNGSVSVTDFSNYSMIVNLKNQTLFDLGKNKEERLMEIQAD